MTGNIKIETGRTRDADVLSVVVWHTCEMEKQILLPRFLNRPRPLQGQAKRCFNVGLLFLFCSVGMNKLGQSKHWPADDFFFFSHLSSLIGAKSKKKFVSETDTINKRATIPDPN